MKLTVSVVKSGIMVDYHVPFWFWVEAEDCVDCFMADESEFRVLTKFFYMDAFNYDVWVHKQCRVDKGVLSCGGVKIATGWERLTDVSAFCHSGIVYARLADSKGNVDIVAFSFSDCKYLGHIGDTVIADLLLKFPIVRGKLHWV